MKIRNTFAVLTLLSIAFAGVACVPEENSARRGTASTDGTDKDSGQKKEKETAKPKGSEADYFKDCIAKDGTDSEKAAVGHVTKINGVDQRNDVFDNAEVYTDLAGGLLSEDSGTAKLIAAAFPTCYDSKNGLVTVYGKDGEMITNGNF